MTKGNKFYNKNTFRVYTAEEVATLSEIEKLQILMVPENGYISNGFFHPEGEDLHDSFDDIIDMFSIRDQHEIEKYEKDAQKIIRYIEGNPKAIREIDSIEALADYIYESLVNNNGEEVPYKYHSVLISSITEKIKSTPFLMSVIYKNQCSSKDLEKAFRKSCSKSKVQKKVKKKTVPLKFVAVVAASVLVVVMSVQVINSISRRVDINKVKESISMLSYDINDPLPEEHALFGTYYQPILSQNTYRTADKQNIWYKTEDIAKDYEKLPYYAVLPAIAYDYSNMYRGTKHMDEVIFYLNQNVKNNPESPIYRYVQGCTNFEEFLIKNGFCYFDKETGLVVADKDGFLKFCEEFSINNKQRFVNDANEHMEELRNGR